METLRPDSHVQTQLLLDLMITMSCGAGCKMTGSEAVIITMLTPKGVSLMQALAYKQAEGVYEADLTSLEVSCSPSIAIHLLPP